MTGAATSTGDGFGLLDLLEVSGELDDDQGGGNWKFIQYSHLGDADDPDEQDSDDDHSGGSWKFMLSRLWATNQVMLFPYLYMILEIMITKIESHSIPKKINGIEKLNNENFLAGSRVANQEKKREGQDIEIIRLKYLVVLDTELL